MALKNLYRLIFSREVAISLRFSCILILAAKVSDFRLKTLIKVSKKRRDLAAAKKWCVSVIFIRNYVALVLVPCK